MRVHLLLRLRSGLLTTTPEQKSSIDALVRGVHRFKCAVRVGRVHVVFVRVLDLPAVDELVGVLEDSGQRRARQQTHRTTRREAKTSIIRGANRLEHCICRPTLVRQKLNSLAILLLQQHIQ